MKRCVAEDVPLPLTLEDALKISERLLVTFLVSEGLRTSDRVGVSLAVGVRTEDMVWVRVGIMESVPVSIWVRVEEGTLVTLRLGMSVTVCERVAVGDRS